MKNSLPHLVLYAASCLLFACGENHHAEPPANQAGPDQHNFGFDRQFLTDHAGSVIEIHGSDSNARVLLSPGYQGRVMTSTATGDTGNSYGWINYDLIRSGEKRSQFNPVGGEERFWMGPEGGQYSIYFKPGDSFNISHWQVPAFIDTVTYSVAEQDEHHVRFTHQATISNYSGTSFSLAIDRTIRVLEKSDIEKKLGITLPDSLRFVGYESENRVRNTGSSEWSRSKGLLSVWLLGMFTPTDQTQVIIPFKPIDHARSFITDTYFGSIPPGRLRVRDSVLLFTCDGKYRSKIGLSPLVAKPIAASFDFSRNVLTVVIPEIYPEAAYVNSKWEIQKEPYRGDVVNAYNDGPLPDGSQLGPFYEIESSSPALELGRSRYSTYSQATCHFEGSYAALRVLAQQLLGIDLDTIK